MMTGMGLEGDAYLRKLAAELRSWPRRGAERDEPQGARFVQVSDTLLKEMADGIERAVRLLMERT